MKQKKMEIYRQDLELLIGLQDWILDGPTDSSISTGKKFNANWSSVIAFLDRVPLERLYNRFLEVSPKEEHKFSITTDLYNHVMQKIDKARTKLIEIEDVVKIVSNIEKSKEENPLEELSMADLLALEKKFQHSFTNKGMKVKKDVQNEFVIRLKRLGYE